MFENIGLTVLNYRGRGGSGGEGPGGGGPGEGEGGAKGECGGFVNCLKSYPSLT
jgi:hypothetical protein